MNKECNAFIASFIDGDPVLESLLNRELEYWSPDDIPITIIFGDFGDIISDQFNVVAENENKRRFTLIEVGIKSGNETLSTAVATGLIEALVIKASEDDNLWPRVLASFGPASRKYVEAWISS